MSVEPSNGLSCRNGGVCATRGSCYYWQKEDKNLGKTRKGSPAYKELLKEYRSAVCNKADKGLCCPAKGRSRPELTITN